MGEEDLLHAEVTRVILGAAYEVHRVLGTGFLESVYEEALAHELRLRQLHVECQAKVPVYYKGVRIGEYIPDLLVENEVIVELKAVKDLAEAHVGVVVAYLAATRKEVALLLNFGRPSLQHRRVVR